MPVYEYQCDNCHGLHEEVQSMSTYKPTKKCPHCKKNKLQRLFGAPLLVKDTAPRTLGALADRNAAKMSKEQMAKIREQQKTAKDEVLYEQLPKGLSRPEASDKPAEAAWYKKEQKVSERQLNQMTDAQKIKYIKTGQT